MKGFFHIHKFLIVDSNHLQDQHLKNHVELSSEILNKLLVNVVTDH